MNTSQLNGRLELTWTNKDQRLLAMDEGRSYCWVDPSDHRVAEVRLLDTVATYGDVRNEIDRAQDNLLIQGDALNALTSLLELPEFRIEYAGKVRLAYLDPPFNSQQAFEHYDDALEHSVWLTMMRDRLVKIRDLLSHDGSVWVHLDDAEMAYCRVLMDEVFGRDNFVTSVIWEKADSPRNSARQFSTDHDYILIYSKSPDWTPRRLARTEAANSIYGNPDNDSRGPWLASDPYANKPYSKGLYQVTGPTGRTFRPPPGRFWRISEERFQELNAAGRIWWGPNNSARPSIKRYLSEVSDLVPRTLWGRDEVGSNRTSKNEMRALYPDAESFATPKPEALLQRILSIATSPSDIVLDCFVGSATTPAVAQKMRRRWVGVEWAADSVHTFALPRLRRVIDGTDSGGATAAARWAGGGGFRHLVVRESMFRGNERVVTLTGWAVRNDLAEAISAQLGMPYQPDPPFASMKGRMRLAVVDGLVNNAVVEVILESLGDNETVAIYGTAVHAKARDTAKSLRPGSSVRKIPASILARYRRTHQQRRKPLTTQLTLPEPVAVS